MPVVLRPVTPAAAERMLAGDPPPGVQVADGYPTEFTTGIAAAVGSSSPLGPFFIHRADDDVVVGEIGGGAPVDGLAGLGYAIVEPCWGRGYATAAVQELVEIARGVDGIERLWATTPLDRPASARVLQKAGFVFVREEDDEHEGERFRVNRFELELRPARG